MDNQRVKMNVNCYNDCMSSEGCPVHSIELSYNPDMESVGVYRDGKELALLDRADAEAVVKLFGELLLRGNPSKGIALSCCDPDKGCSGKCIDSMFDTGKDKDTSADVVVSKGEVRPPEYACVEGVELKLEGHMYYRHAGHWGVQFIRDGDGFLTVCPHMPRLHNKKLVAISQEVWRLGNKGGQG